MDILPKELQNIIYDYVWTDVYAQVMMELKSVVKIDPPTYSEEPEKLHINIEWLGYDIKEGYSLAPFLPDKPLWDSRLRFKNPKYEIYVPNRSAFLNRENLNWQRRQHKPEIFRKIKSYHNVMKMSLIYYLGEFVSI